MEHTDAPRGSAGGFASRGGDRGRGDRGRGGKVRRKSASNFELYTIFKYVELESNNEK